MPSPPTRHRRPRLRSTGIDVCVAGTPVISLEPGPGRVRVGLVMHPLDRVVDVSVQPTAACETLRDAGRRGPDIESAVEAAARQALIEARQRCNSWAPPDDAGLLAGFGGAAFPLLAAAYETGSAPVRQVPRWAEDVVAAPDARAGARVAFGERTTRPVIRALVDTLRPEPPSQIDFSSLALAMIGREVLQPDCLARVLGAAHVAHPSHHLPDPSTLARARKTVSSWGATRAERVLLDAATTANGMVLLLDTVRYSHQLRGHGPTALPNRLRELHDIYRSRVASAPEERPPPEPPPMWRFVEDPLDLPPPPRPRIFAPPADLQPVAASTLLPATPAVRALDGGRAGDLTFVVPRTAGDLVRWGALLSNCIGGFGPAVAAGRCAIIGIERADTLAYAIEVGADGTIHQFAGRANRDPDEAVRRAIVGALASAGIVAPQRPDNVAWMDGITQHT